MSSRNSLIVGFHQQQADARAKMNRTTYTPEMPCTVMNRSAAQDTTHAAPSHQRLRQPKVGNHPSTRKLASRKALLSAAM